MFSGILLLAVVAPPAYEFFKHSRFLTNAPYYQKDRVAGHVHSPHFHYTFDWPEHDSGYISFATNNLGFREDHPTEAEKTMFRILVTGDSHTDGVVWNVESFPNKAEHHLENVEFLNGGTGYYTFQHYRGFLEKYLFLSPDVFILTLYTGNDFIETLSTAPNWQLFPDSYFSFWYRLHKKIKLHEQQISSQSLNQELYFSLFPKKKNVALAFSKTQLMKIRDICSNNNINLWVVLLPSKLRSTDSGITPLETWFADQVKSFLQKEHIITVDLLPDFTGKPSLYWEKDHHLSTKGHKITSQKIIQTYKEVILKTD